MVESMTGRPIDRTYAETRIRWEPLYEATQIKGDGETHPFLSPNDEYLSRTLGWYGDAPHVGTGDQR